MSFLFGAFVYVIPLIIAYFLIYFAVKNAIVDANRDVAQSKDTETYRSLV